MTGDRPRPRHITQLRALVAAGHHPRALSEESRLDIPWLMRHRGPLPPAVAERIDALYEHRRYMAGTDPAIAVKAIRLGWLPAATADPEPVPDPTPTPPPARKMTRAEVADAVRLLAGAGWSDGWIASFLDVTLGAVKTARKALKLPPGRRMHPG